MKITFCFAYRVELLRVIPGLDQTVPHGEGRRLVCTLVVKVESGTCQSVLNMVHD